MKDCINTSILKLVGNTPLVKLDRCKHKGINIFCKLEYYNPTGSVKDRAAFYILRKLLENKTISHDTVIMESSSGNFGVSLSAYCNFYNLKFYCFIDPNISPINEYLIRSFNAKTIKTTKPDCNGGYLLSRIEELKRYHRSIIDSYWVNQYENPLNSDAYYYTLGKEICTAFKNLDFMFICVSSGGTITGLSRRIKEKFPNAKIIAVDILGSTIFGGKPQKRNIPGIGSSKVPVILEKAFIDDVIIVDEFDTIEYCNSLLNDNYIFAGGSSGAVLAGINKFFTCYNISNYHQNVVTILPDRGERYFNTVYCSEWKINLQNLVNIGK